ncbi:MAG: hypothetical protein V7K64_16150 [Nostoc sp.]|uniref:hypothetical protein n=1 Tax=Nostoc sp. TaxID=1180 RepID=UPI002FFCEDDD
MSIQTIKSDLLVDLSTEEQQLLSGGIIGRIRTRGVFRYGNRRYPVRLFGIVRGLPESNGEESGGSGGSGGSGESGGNGEEEN